MATQKKRIVTWEEDPAEKEITLAAQRVGTKPVQQVRWLFRLGTQDPQSISAGQISDQKWEILAFIMMTVHRSDKLLVAGRSHRFTDAVTSQLIEELKSGLESLRGSGWEITKPKITEKLMLIDPPHFGSARHVDLLEPKDYFVPAAFDLLKSQLDRIGRCGNPKCKKLFIAARRGRPMYCGPRCSAYVRVGKYRTRLSAKKKKPGG